MKKISWATSKPLIKQIAAPACLVAVSAGTIFGISAGTFKIQYSDLTKESDRLLAAQSSNYYAQDIMSQWNMNQSGVKGEKGYIAGYEQPSFTSNKTSEGLWWWKKLHGTDAIPLFENYPSVPGTDPKDMNMLAPEGTDPGEKAKKTRRQYTSLIIDGATKTQLDRSFNQSIFNGIANFITNVKHKVSDPNEAIAYKPAQDKTSEFVDVYIEALKHSRVLSLAGFSHVTPLNSLCTITDEGKMDFGSNKFLSNAGFILIDGDIAHNQNLASVLFRCDQSSFLTALATCMLFLNNLDQFHKGYRDLSVATYGGIGMPTVSIYMGGFQRGVEFFNEFILKQTLIHEHAYHYMYNKEVPADSHFVTQMLPNSKYKKEIEDLRNRTSEKRADVEELCKKIYEEFSVKMIKIGGFKDHFTGSFAPGDAIGITKQFLNRGASAILPVCGAQYIDTVQEIMNQKANCIAIGVDCALEDSDFQRPFKNSSYKDKTKAPDGTVPPQASNVIKFSAVKDITTATEKLLRLSANGHNWDEDNLEPWKSSTPIPPWDPKEEISLDDLYYVGYGDKIDIIGFKKDFKREQYQHVLNIPLKFPTKNGVKLVHAIRQPEAGEGVGECVKFDAYTLADIDTLKISDDGTNSVHFGKYAFDYNTQGESHESLADLMKHSGFRYIDLSQLDTKLITCDARPLDWRIFRGIQGIQGQKDAFAYKKGVIKFNRYDYGNYAKQHFSDFFEGPASQENNWVRLEPAPLKAACSYGFRTCGNIENGMSSISPDGWPYVVDALRYVKYNLAGSTSVVGFLALFQAAAEEYRTGVPHGEVDKFFDMIANLNETNWFKEMCTFNKEALWYKYYSHTMAILGTALKIGGLQFPRNMTIRFDSNGKPILLSGYDLQMPFSILDWLRTNMYYIC